MGDGRQIAEFVEERIGHVFRRPLMYGGTPEAVDSILHYDHELWAVAHEREGDFQEVSAAFHLSEGCGSASFEHHYRTGHPAASEDEVACYVVSMWRKIGEHLGLSTAGSPSLGRAETRCSIMIDTERGESLDILLQRLTEVIDWCAPRALLSDPKHCLRTPELAPEPLAGSRKDVVCSVARRRHFELRWPEPRLAKSLGGGRLLGYEPDRNLSCGAAEGMTGGFFDCLNVPPWDTWVAYLYEVGGKEYLLAWIPPAFIELVAGGISVNPEECIWWVDESQTALSNLLDGSGILQSDR
jgi:hypothetical protein